MTSRLIKILAILAVATLGTGCKLAVMVPSGGDVTSASGTRNCTGGNLCEHNITDSTFNESFTAVARPGYVFSKWNKGAGFLCGDSTNPTCVISNVGTAGNAAIEAVIATGQHFYAMPLFEFVGIDTDGDGQKDHLDADDDNDGVLDGDDACPLVGPNYDGFGCPGTTITDTVTVDGKVWAQPDLFAGVTWSQITAVCPSGPCTGILNGHSVTGWTFASVDDVNALFNYYIGAPDLELGPGPDHAYPGVSAHLIFGDGFRGIFWNEMVNIYSVNSNNVEGIVRDLAPTGVPYVGLWKVALNQYWAGSSEVYTDRLYLFFGNQSGAWMYRVNN